MMTFVKSKLTYQDEWRRGKKSDDTRIRGNSWDGCEPDTRNIWRCRRRGKLIRTKRENWLVFRVCGWKWSCRISSSKTRVIIPGPVEEKEKLLLGWRNKWKCDLVDAHGDRFWALGVCIGEFSGGRKETNFVLGDEAGFPIL